MNASVLPLHQYESIRHLQKQHHALLLAIICRKLVRKVENCFSYLIKIGQGERTFTGLNFSWDEAYFFLYISDTNEQKNAQQVDQEA